MSAPDFYFAAITTGPFTTSASASVRTPSKLWKQSIADDAQQHYTSAGRDKGLRCLYDTWVKIGEDEKCDWIFTLDEQKNNLRIDMWEYPSKGFLLQNDLNTDEDYCDHCIGWIGPALESIDAQVVSHEHNHCGQCWWEMGMKGTSHQTLDLDIDIRKAPRWARGYVVSGADTCIL